MALRKTKERMHHDGDGSGSEQISSLSPPHSQRCTRKDLMPLITKAPALPNVHCLLAH